MRRARLLFIAAGLVFGAAGAAPAQDPDLERMLRLLANSWARGDATAIVGLTASRGISLDLQGGAVGPLSPRQAAALLRRVFDERETVAMRTGMVRVVGDTRQAFGELTWVSRMRGTTIPDRTTIFLGLVREENGWRITQIRILP